MWRDTGRRVRFFTMDAYLAWFFMFLIFIPSFITLGAVLFAMIFFYALEYFGYSMPNAIRKIFVIVVGKKRRARQWWRTRNFND